MSKIKITEQDVGRSYIGRDGREYEILSFSEKSVYQFTVGIKEQALETIAANGKASLIDELCGADFKEWADEGEKMESKIKLKVGQKVKFRDGIVGEIIRKTKNPNYDFIAINYNDSLLKTSHQEDGFFYPRRDNALYDIVEILEEPKEEEMEENLKEKYSKLVGQTFIVKEEDDDDDDDDEITITSVSESFVFFNSKNYEDKYNATFEDFEKMKIRKKTQQENLKENKGKFELSITVNDINNSCKNEKLYCLGFSELIEEVSKLTLNKICLTKFVSEQEVFENKGDTLKLSKIIKLNGKELGKVTIEITQLED